MGSVATSLTGHKRITDQLSDFGRPTNLMPPGFSTDASPLILLNSSRNWFPASVHLPKRVLMFSIKPKAASASIACQNRRPRSLRACFRSTLDSRRSDEHRTQTASDQLQPAAAQPPVRNEPAARFQEDCLRCRGTTRLAHRYPCWDNSRRSRRCHQRSSDRADHIPRT